MDLGPLGPADPWTGRTPCPSKHQQAEKVETVGGEHVGWLCPDCDAVLPPEWTSYRSRSQMLAEDHDSSHHGAPSSYVYGCPRCGDEIKAAIH
jgi:hypothetical protein